MSFIPRKYIIQAYYNWIVDCGHTPHIVVDTSIANVEVPVSFIKDGQIVLNIAPRAIDFMTWDTSTMGFSARFNGKTEDVIVPFNAILAISSRETGYGTMFETYEIERDESTKKPSLTIVK